MSASILVVIAIVFVVSGYVFMADSLQEDLVYPPHEIKYH